MAGKFILWHGGQYKKTEALDLTGTSAGTSQAPQVYANTSYSVSRDNERSSTLHVTVWGCVYRIYGYSPAGNYLWNGTGTRFPYNCYVYLEVGGVEKRLGYKPSSTNYWTTDYSDGTQYFDIEWASNEALPIYFRAAADCKLNGGGYCFQSDRPKQLIEWLPVPTYNPYTPSSIWLNPDDYTKIGRIQSSSTTSHSSGQFGVHYSYNAGTNNNIAITLGIHDYNSTTWGVRWEPVLRYISDSNSRSMGLL